MDVDALPLLWCFQYSWGSPVSSHGNTRTRPSEGFRERANMQMSLVRNYTGKHPEGTLKGSITGPGLEYF